MDLNCIILYNVFLSGEQIINVFKILHGSFNLLVMGLFIHQGLTGLRIRKGRKSGITSLAAIKSHRVKGPALTIMGALGFIGGAGMAFLDRGHIFESQLHFTTGAVITLAIISTYLISRQIKRGTLSLRDIHLAAGILIISLYPVQIFLGLDLLL
jgi:hypothetical protein